MHVNKKYLIIKLRNKFLGRYCMKTVYKKTLKGVEECALRSQGLQLKLREYLKQVDGFKSAEDIQRANPNLREVDAVLIALNKDGYIEVLH
jgi:hypothetical protein